MSIIEAFILGLVQGITEFFPVSSSGHLKLAQIFFGYENLSGLVVFDLVCHLGTLLAIIWVFRLDILDAIERDRFLIGMLFLAITPLFIIYPFIKQIKSVMNQPEYLGPAFLLTAFLLFVGELMERYRPQSVGLITSKRRSLLDAFTIGCFQLIALFPGVSRSGSTISGARLLGWERDKATRFSFLLAIPTICGGIIVEFRDYVFHPELITKLPLSAYLVGFTSSFVVGLGALYLLLKLVKQNRLVPFAFYCAIIGLITIKTIGLPF